MIRRTPMQPRVLLAALCLLLGANHSPAGIREFASEHCFDCHGAATQKAGLNLEKLDLSLANKKNAHRWESVFDRVARGEMPPKTEDQPSQSERTAFLSDLNSQLRSASLAHEAANGRGPVRRLTRTEYETALNDLLNIRTDLRSLFPEDAITSGFDKVGEGLTLSAAHFAAYQAAAEKALQTALERGTVLDQDESGVAVFQRAKDTFTVWGGWVEGDTLVLPSRLLYPNRSLFTVPAPRSGRYRITVRAQARHNNGQPLPVAIGIHDTRAPKPSDAPDTRILFDVPEESPRTFVTELDLDTRQQAHLFGPTLESGMKINKIKPTSDSWSGKTLLIHQLKIEGPLRSDGTLDAWPGEAYRQLFDELDAQPLSKVTGTPAIKGKPEPFVPTSTNPKEDSQRLLKRFARRAFRRNPSPDDIDDIVATAHASMDSGIPFHRAMLDGFKAILCSPHFFLLEERPGNLDAFALASRLALFIWNTVPDEPLLAAAENGELLTPSGRATQLERLLNDPRSRRFEQSFVDQWLDLKNINATTPDGVLYAEIVPMMTVSAEQETRHFFHELLAADRSVLECVQSDWTYSNSLLSALYDLPETHGYELRKVSLPEQSPRGGFLTQASILKVTADGAKTSPILRGKWVNERILGIVPPDPPDDVPKIEPDIRGTTTVREQLARHRDTPACMSCHAIIDPPGFALEPFDVIGGHRTFYRMPKSTGQLGTLHRFGGRRVHRGPAVESGYSMPDGRSFKDINEYRALLLEDEQMIVSAFTSKLLTYATGASLQFADRDDLKQIIEAARHKRFGLRSLLHAIVQSRPFLQK